MKRIILAILLLAIVGSGAYFLSGKKSAQETDSEKEGKSDVRFIFSKAIEEVEILDRIAEEKGFYEKNGVTVEKIIAEKGFNTILMAGEGDVLISTYTGSLNAFLNNGETRALADLFVPFNHQGVSRFSKGEESKITKVAIQDLAGDPSNVMKNALKNLGIDSGSVETVAVTSYSGRLAMLEKGEVDFIILHGADVMSEVAKKDNLTIYESGEITRGLKSMRAITSSEKAINSNPQGIRSFVNAIYDTLEYMDNNPEELKSLLQEKYNYSAEQAENFYLGYASARKDVAFVPSAGFARGLAENLKAENKINSDRNMEEYIYAGFAQEAVGRK
ncbi:MAG TPA: hypothetical protein DIT25_02745 [Candidatus Moranbacteria bacterium]|nr:hypothetical protein [Candidatus Moranbacteria bacterium]